MPGKRKTKSGINRNGLGSTDNKVTGRHWDLSGLIEVVDGHYNGKQAGREKGQKAGGGGTKIGDDLFDLHDVYLLLEAQTLSYFQPYTVL
jgi:hypothetical protein